MATEIAQSLSSLATRLSGTGGRELLVRAPSAEFASLVMDSEIVLRDDYGIAEGDLRGIRYVRVDGRAEDAQRLASRVRQAVAPRKPSARRKPSRS